MEHINTFLVGIIWQAAVLATDNSMKHELSLVRLDTAQLWIRSANRLGWKDVDVPIITDKSKVTRDAYKAFFAFN